MTLFKQIIFLITILLFLLLIIVFTINFNVSKSFVKDELYQRAKNSVNTLSLSIGNVSEDVFLMETAIAAMFDGGHFQRISLKNAEGTLVCERKQNLTIQGVPKFFIKMISLDAPVAEAIVSNGWNIVGTLQIQGHTGAAYLRIWNIFKDISLSFFTLWVSCVIINSFLLKLLLLPLGHIREQAEAIEKNKFIVNSKLPSTLEFKKVVIQMNKMVRTVQKNYERSLETIKQFRRIQYVDKVSKLYNKAYFIRRIQAYLNSQTSLSQGCVALFSMEGLDRLKSLAGFEVYEEFIQTIADILREKTQSIENCLVARLNPSEFSLILPVMSPQMAEEKIAPILSKIENLEKPPQVEKEFLFLASALVPYAFGETSSHILSNLDYTLARAKSDPKSSPVIFENILPNPLGRMEWKRLIENAIESDGFDFISQTILDADGYIYHHDIHIEMTEEQGRNKASGIFMPMAMELKIAKKIDQYVITKIVNFLNSHDSIEASVNISADLIQDRESLIWIRHFLMDNKNLTHRLSFEISETTLTNFPKLSIDFAELVTACGCGCGVDNFTITEESLELLQKLEPDYIKIDYIHISDSVDLPESNITLGSLLNITEILNIKLIGCKIETSEQALMIKNAGVVYFQGNHLSQIRRLEDL